MNKRASVAFDKEIGKRIRVRRLQLDKSQNWLAESLGLTFQQIQKYEKGVNRVAGGRLQQIAKILDVSPSYFFESGTKADSNELFDLLDSSYSLRLLKAFARIQDSKIRHTVVALLEEIGSV